MRESPCALIGVENSFRSVFDRQQRNFMIARKVKNQIVGLTKEAISALTNDQNAYIGSFHEQIDGLWVELQAFELRLGQREQMLSEAGQEIIELDIVEASCLFLFKGGDIRDWVVVLERILSKKNWPQTSLAGLEDAVSELGKMVFDHLAKTSLTLTERVEVRSRFIAMAEVAVGFLDRFPGTPSQVIDNTQGRFMYEQTFAGRLMKLRNIVDQHKTALAFLKDLEAAFEPQRMEGEKSKVDSE